MNSLFSWTAKQFSAWKESLIVHIRNIHEGVKFDCDQCDFKAGTPSVLNVHRKAEHEGFTYECDKCDFVHK